MKTQTGLTPTECQRRQRRRLAAVKFFERKLSQAEIARRLGVSRQAVHRWHQAWKASGRQGLASAGPPGPAGYLTDTQVEVVVAEVERGAAVHGWANDRWTVPRIRQLIAETTGVWYASVGSLWVGLRRMGLTCQLPARRARERDEEAIRTWRKETWTRVKAPRRSRGPGSSSKTNPVPD